MVDVITDTSAFRKRSTLCQFVLSSFIFNFYFLFISGISSLPICRKTELSGTQRQLRSAPRAAFKKKVRKHAGHYAEITEMKEESR